MATSRSSDANISDTRKLAQHLRSGKPEIVADAYRELRVPPKGW